MSDHITICIKMILFIFQIRENETSGISAAGVYLLQLRQSKQPHGGLIETLRLLLYEQTRVSSRSPVTSHCLCYFYTKSFLQFDEDEGTATI